MAAYQTSNNAYQGQGQFVYQTVQVTPAPSGPSTGGGRWFGYYPTFEEKAELKAEIKKVVKEKKRIERILSFSPNREDLVKLIEGLNEAQKRLDALTTEYVYLIESWKTYRRQLDEEEEEFLLFIASNL